MLISTEKKIKLIIVGDCMQLPPVEKLISGYYFNGGEYDLIHKKSYFCSLSEVKRQYNTEFFEILKSVRMTMHTKMTLNTLNIWKIIKLM